MKLWKKFALALGLTATFSFFVSCGSTTTSVCVIETTEAVLRMRISQTCNLDVETFTVNGEEGNKSNLTYFSEDDNVATVENGIVTANGVGETYVGVRYGEAIAKTKVIVQADECNISLERKEIFLAEGNESAIRVTEFTVNGENAEFSLLAYTSSNPAVAEVKNGEIIGKSVGAAEISVEYQTTKTVATVHVLSNTEECVILPVKNSVGISTAWKNYNLEIESFTIGGNPVDVTEVELVSENTEIVQTEGDKLIPVAVGETSVSLRYNGKTYNSVAVKVLDGATDTEVESFDKNAVAVYGRAYSDGSALVFDNVNSGLDFWFYGTECKIKLDVPVLSATEIQEDKAMRIRVYVDGEIKEGYTENFDDLYVNGSFIALDKCGTDVEYTVASGLEEGMHRIQILKASEQHLESPYRQLKVRSIVSDKDSFVLKQRTPEKEYHIEFFGDSISCGAGNLNVAGDEWILPKNGDGTQTYASYTARALNATCSVVSQSGLCVKAELLGAGVSLVELWDKYSQINKTKCVLNADTDLVVINLGTNDYSAIQQGKTTAEELETDAVAILTEMKKAYPKAKFVWCYGMMGEVGTIKDALTAAIETMGGAEQGFYYCMLYPDTSGGATHPTVAGHIRAGKTLTDFLIANQIVTVS